MHVSVVLPCLIVLFQFHGIFCDGHQKQKPVGNKPNKTATAKDIVLKAKTVSKTVNKTRLPINERNEPKDVRKINRILEEIASIAHNHNQTKGIHKIRHLVDEIDNLDNMKSDVKTDVNTKKKELTLNKKETKVKETHKLPQESKTVLKMDTVKKTTNPVKKITGPVHIENKESININKSLLTNARRFYNEIPTHVVDDATTNKTKDEDHIEIEEHKYEEELLRSPYCNTYNFNMAHNYNPGSIPYAYNRYANNIENNNYPLSTYGQYYGKSGYYANSPSLSEQPYCQNNGDYMRYRKAWLDRNTIISARTPNEQFDRIVNANRNELTNIRNPDYYRQYYSVSQKHFSSNNGVYKNQYEYYVNPYQYRK